MKDFFIGLVVGIVLATIGVLSTAGIYEIIEQEVKNEIIEQEVKKAATKENTEKVVKATQNFGDTIKEVVQ